jgi:hypothetical protein
MATNQTPTEQVLQELHNELTRLRARLVTLLATGNYVDAYMAGRMSAGQGKPDHQAILEEVARSGKTVRLHTEHGPVELRAVPPVILTDNGSEYRTQLNKEVKS